MLYCCHDLNWNIRLAICEGIPKIAGLLSKDNVMDIFYCELVEFLNDVEILVRLTAIEAVLEIFDMLEAEQIRSDFVPVVMQHLSLELDDACNSRMSRCIGKITFNLLNFAEATSELNDSLLDYFKQLVAVEDADVVKNVCYNLPGMYFIFNKGELDFAAIVAKHVASKDPAVRLQMAKCFHEVVGICGMGRADPLAFREPFYALLHDHDPEVRKTMIHSLDACVMNFFSAMAEAEINAKGGEDESGRLRVDFVEEIQLSVRDLIAVQRPDRPAESKAAGPRDLASTTAGGWRLRLVFYEKLCTLFDAFPQEAIKQAFFESARLDFLNGAEPLRE